MKIPMLKNSSGKESASFSFSFISFNAILLWLLLYIFSGIGHYTVPEFSGVESMAFLSPIFALYFVSKKKSDTEE